MEHLAHVIFGFHELKMKWPTKNELCQNFLPDCPNSPCKNYNSVQHYENSSNNHA